MTQDCYFLRMLFSKLLIWDDDQTRTPTAQMAIDEALLEFAEVPVLRIYRWAAPAVTFGYAQRHRDVLPLAAGRPLVRRWTGGGVVFHGDDLTLSLALPPNHSLAAGRTDHIYLKIHEAVLDAIRAQEPSAKLATAEDCQPGAACFVSPALHDILLSSKKICGGALRRGKRGALYQGSLHASLSIRQLGRCLADSWALLSDRKAIEAVAKEHERNRYSTAEWNLMR